MHSQGFEPSPEYSQLRCQACEKPSITCTLDEKKSEITNLGASEEGFC